MEKAIAKQLLRTALGDSSAKFRAGQWEAIDALVNGKKKLLVVQRTGWGKSSVYFIATRIFRDRNMGLAIIVSPLLALMRNQIDSARRLGINAVTMNSTNNHDWDDVTEQIRVNKVDCLLISPERLANDDFINNILMPIAGRISLIVIDEAHCISDWGHDFRPDYRRIVNILKQIPPNTPVLCTTATANNRVVEDIRTQLSNIEIQRGELGRESLVLQNIKLLDQASRLAWLTTTIPTLQGTGIVYVLTTRDADLVARWLVANNINAKAYYGDVNHPDFENNATYREYLEDQLLNNHLKVLVATNALGMGYDKPDLGFVIHYQAPNSIVSYYQQVGRAGRGINNAFGILLSGKEDENIHEYFREAAFPSLGQIRELLDALDKSDGLSVREIEENTNLRNGQIEKVLKLLSVENPSTVIKDGSKWRRTIIPFVFDQARINHLTKQREHEWDEVKNYIHSQNCLMYFLRSALDDNNATACGKCSVCMRHPILSTAVDAALSHKAATYLKHAEMTIKPKIQVATNAFPIYGLRGNLSEGLRAQEGRVLSCWGDTGWGRMVLEGKHNNHFDDALVDALAEMVIQRWKPATTPTWLTCVPSLNHPTMVPDLARRFAAKLGIPFLNIVNKIKVNEPQKFQQNRFHQCRNLDGVFSIVTPIPNGSVLLVDDIVDSGWTFAVLAALLQKAGSGVVYPVALASTSVKDA